MPNKFNLVIRLVLFITYASGEINVSNATPMKPGGRIVGGIDVEIDQFPWQVSVQEYSHLCGATIISENWILTAAHCAIGSRNLSIRAGSSRFFKNGIKVGVKEVIIHKNFNPDQNDYDFALLRTAKPMNLNNKTMKAVILPDQNEILRDRVRCIVSGWGVTNENSSTPSPHLKAVQVRIINKVICKYAYAQIYNTVTDQMICAGRWKGLKDACQGDSGGPLICDSVRDRGVFKLFGVVSWGYGCAVPMYPGVYSRVQSVRSWIHEISGA